jgi:glutamyl-tRNA synthetase/glutamyl-Q tRNA(Asp) synthetase
MSVVTRFAPAPTGELHLGHVLNAIIVWGVARGLGGRILLRIEDHDRQRSRHEFETSILDDLDWLGFIADTPATEALRAGRCVDGRQSDRHAIYAHALERLKARGLVYACECSRAQIASGSAGDREIRYPGTCAGKQLAEGPGRGLRVRLERSVERFVDLRHGPQEQIPAEQCGDVLVRDREGNYTYQFVAAVDDTAQNVTLVIRGDDLLASTGRQMQLARLLGRHEPPQFLHHALIMKSPTQKLSKADRDTSVADLRRAGWPPEAVIGRAAALGGLVDPEAPLSAEAAAAMAHARFESVTESLR